MFGKMDEASTNEEDDPDEFDLEKKYESSQKMNSYWGKSIKKTNIPKYTMDMFMNGR